MTGRKSDRPGMLLAERRTNEPPALDDLPKSERAVAGWLLRRGPAVRPQSRQRQTRTTRYLAGHVKLFRVIHSF